MQAVVIDKGELRFEPRPDPVPGDTEILVAVRAAGLNGADILQRQGRYPAPPGWPTDIPGMEMAGDVVSVGSRVTRHAVGDRVMALLGGGAQATLATVEESHALPVPKDLTWAEAGGFPEVFFTAFDALGTQARLQMGERLLVSGAAGGVGTAAVQLGAVAGAHVVASVRDAERREGVVELGAAEVIDPADVDRHGPYDVVLELVGAESLSSALGLLATGARIVVIGIGAGARLELDLRALMGHRARISGSTLRSRSPQEKAVVAEAVAHHVLPLLAAGRIRVPVCETVPMSDAAAGYDRFAAGSKLGKIVLMA